MFTPQQGKSILTQQPKLQQQMVFCPSPQEPDQFAEEWNSSMFPYHYHFTKKCAKITFYRAFPNNLIFSHRDHKIMAMSITSQPLVNRDFQYT